MYIGPQEFQWILNNAGKEPVPWAERLAEFRRVIQVGSQVRNGNR